MVSPAQTGAAFYAAVAVAGAVLFGLSTGVLMAPHLPVLGDRLPELTCLQVSYGHSRLMALLGTFSPEQRSAIAEMLVPGDLVFAAGYGCLFGGLLGLLALRLRDGWQRTGFIVMWAPPVAALLDGIEDLSLHQLVTIFPARGLEVLAVVASACATVKYLLLSGVAPAWGLVGSARGLRADRRPGALLVYALVVACAVAFVARPAQQLPACFQSPPGAVH